MLHSTHALLSNSNTLSPLPALMDVDTVLLYEEEMDGLVVGYVLLIQMPSSTAKQEPARDLNTI